TCRKGRIAIPCAAGATQESPGRSNFRFTHQLQCSETFHPDQESRPLKLSYLFAALLAAATLCAAQQPATTYIRAGRLFDSTSDNYRENVVIVVEGERIKAVQPAGSAQIPSG